MPSFFRKKGTASGDTKRQRATATPSLSASLSPAAAIASRKASDAGDAIKSAFAGNEGLLQLHDETTALLRLVKTTASASSTPAKSPSAAEAMRQRARSTAAASVNGATPTKARMTIEVLDDDGDDDVNGTGSSPTTSTAADQVPAKTGYATAAARNAASPLRSTADPFAFDREEARVRKAADTFYPDTSPSKRALDKQRDAFTHEQARLERLAHDDAAEQARRRDEIAYHERHKLPNRLETSAITIQAYARGYLCRKQQQTEASAQPVVPVDQWHEVRDIERNEVWYYNARTGQSQWDVPLGFVPPPLVATTAAAAATTALQSSSSVSELPAIKSASSSDASRTAASSFPAVVQRSTSLTGAGVEVLPPLSPSTSACSSARSDASERTATPTMTTQQQQQQHESRPGSSSRTSMKATRSAGKMSSSASLPVLQQPRVSASYVVTSVPNPWECDSVMGGSDASLCSQRTCDDDLDDGDSANSFARRRSVLDRRSEGGAFDEDGDVDTSARAQANDSDDVAGDWQINDTLFLADGSRNSKLRDTIRNALYVSKFDSISTLIASNVVLRKKAGKSRRRGSDPTQPQDSALLGSPTRLGAAPSLASPGHSRSTKRPTSREIVLGKREAPMFVALLSTDKSKAQGPSPLVRSGGAKDSSPSRSAFAKAKTRGVASANPLASPPRIRDLVDPGFDTDDPQTPQTAHGSRGDPSDVDGDAGDGSDDGAGPKARTKQRDAAVCFNCWSSSTGRFCELHADPNAHRKVKASESALMCANWDLDQLRRKYRAEEIQEIFMKQRASLRYDKKLKQYVTVVECKHPIYRSADALLTAWNKTMRRKLHTRAWFRSFMEQLRSGRVPKADAATPGLLKLKNTIQNNRWCTKYSDSVREFHPVAPVTRKNQSGQRVPIPDVIMVHPAQPQLRHWTLVTEYATPVELYKPRVYDVPPRRCVPMPTPSYLEDIPLPVPNVFIDCGHIASWFERLCARFSAAALSKAALQIHACSPPRGFNEPRRTKHVTPLTVLFATFGRKPTPGNLAVGGLSAELLIHMLVTTYVPAQFGNFIVFDRRAIAPSTTRDHDATYACLAIAPTDPVYVFRALEHALNVRRPPCIALATRAVVGETEAMAIASKRFPLNRPEQTGEELAHGFRTFWLVDAFAVPDAVPSVLVQPNSDVLSPNATSMNTTVTTRVDRTYPFCIPTTKENTPIEFIHLLWIGQSSRNQPQVFTTLGAQQPGEFMKNSDPSGALGVCTTVIYRSWAFMQSSPYEEFVTDDGVAYWYDKQSGETFWTRPILPAEVHRGKDGDVDGVVVHGDGEVATRGVGADDDVKYPQQIVRKYMTKSMEAPDEKDRRMRLVAASAKKHDIVIDLSSGEGNGARGDAAPASPSQRRVLEKIQVPHLAFKRGESGRARQQSKGSGARALSPAKQSSGSGTKEEHLSNGARHSSNAAVSGAGALDSNTKQLIDSITQALGSALPGSGGTGGSGVDMLQLGIGLGMGLGLRAQQHGGGGSGHSLQSARVVASSRSSRSDRSRAMGTSFGGGDLGQHDEEGSELDDDDASVDGMSTARSCDSVDSSDSLSARSTVSSAPSVGMTLPPDEQELQGRMPPGHLAKTPGYQTHALPGEGTSWLPKPVDASSESQTAVAGFGGAVHQRVACLPKDFVAAVTSTKTCKMQANYLPVIKNTNEPRSVGVVRPRGALDEWLPVEYSPWSAGRAVFGTQFIRDLMQRPELVAQVSASAPGSSTAPGAAAAASGASIAQREKVTQAMKESQQLEEIFSHCRHGKYDDVELSLNSPDWTLHIDAKDAMGNTLLSIACQNNNKRIAKLCLRRGADINTQNLNGQTVLHYCHEYGFHDLLDYLMDKGARDDILNADGLTCYEGLNKEAVDAL